MHVHVETKVSHNVIIIIRINPGYNKYVHVCKTPHPGRPGKHPLPGKHPYIAFLGVKISASIFPDERPYRPKIASFKRPCHGHLPGTLCTVVSKNEMSLIVLKVFYKE